MAELAPTRGTLRALLSGDGIVVCPGVTNPLYARLAEDLGFQAVYTTGAGIANNHFGVPDIGLVTMSESVDINRRIVNNVKVPVFADIDTGFGGPTQVARTVQEFESAGVAGLQLEDQINPKRCGHFEGKSVVDIGEMVERILAALDARRDSNVLIVARTDARQSEGFASALDRAHAYVAAGAEAIFVEAPESHDELAAIPKEFDVPAIANMVEGGATPLYDARALEAMGYRMVLFANTLSRLAAAAVRAGLEVLLRDGSSDAVLDDMLSWEDRQAIVRLDTFQHREAEIIERASSFAKSLTRTSANLD